MAESPALVSAYTGTQQALSQHGALTPQENNLVQIAISRENGCQYCVNGHSMVGEAMLAQEAEEVANLRKGYRLTNAKHEALRAFALSVYENQGRVSDEELETFLAAGYTRRHALDVVAGIGAKVMSNFTNQLAQTPLDEPIQSYRDSH
jgi:AhpD family alkylhydroperoxidase